MQYKQTGNTKSVIFFELITVRLQKKKFLLRLWRLFLSSMRVKFVVGSLLRSERFFSGYSGFPLFLKN